MRQDRPSATARLIAGATISAAYRGIRPRAGEDSLRWCRRFLSTSPSDRRFLRSVESPFGRAWWSLVESTVAPGLSRHFVMRKAWIERTCRTAIGEGFSQVIVIGAGLDTLGVRLAAEPGGVRVVEVDHPATQRAKATAIAAERPERLVLVPADLSKVALPAALGVSGASPALDPERSTFVIVEGLLMYMAPDDVTTLLNAVASLPVPELRAIFTFLAKSNGRRPGFRSASPLADVWLRWRAEPFRWGASPEEMIALLERSSFSVDSLVGAAALAEMWPAQGPLLEGEVLALARRAAPPTPPHAPAAASRPRSSPA